MNILVKGKEKGQWLGLLDPCKFYCVLTLLAGLEVFDFWPSCRCIRIMFTFGQSHRTRAIQWTNQNSQKWWGFAKRRPAAQRPTAQRLASRDGPAARRSSSWFSTVFCPAVNPRACTDLHRVWAYNGPRWVWVRLPFWNGKRIQMIKIILIFVSVCFMMLR